MYVIGIDGGGTKTKGILATESGKVLAESIVGATNLHTVEHHKVKQELHKLFYELRDKDAKAFDQAQIVYAGMAGIAHSDNKNKLHRLLTSLTSTKVQIEIDALNALYSGTLGEPGIVQISGTGSITYGINHQGKQKRIGGWGYLFSDYGSGYAIGRDGLSEAFKAYDGLNEATFLMELFEKHYQVNRISEIVGIIYQNSNPRTEIASLSRLVVEAANSGDETAKSIFERNGVLLGESIICLVNQLFDEAVGTVPVVLTGGLFQNTSLLVPSIQRMLQERASNARIIIPQMEPVGGVVIAALKEIGVTLSEGFIVEFNESMKRAK